MGFIMKGNIYQIAFILSSILLMAGGAVFMILSTVVDKKHETLIGIVLLGGLIYALAGFAFFAISLIAAGK